MALYLVQHGKSIPREIDRECGLSAEGHSEVVRMADIARQYRVRPKLIEHSGKKRARQTAELLAAALEPEGGLREGSGLNPLDDTAAFARTIDSHKDLMVVGHLPFLERLVSQLITGSSSPPVFKLQNGGILCLDKDPDTHSWVIKWALMPKIT